MNFNLVFKNYLDKVFLEKKEETFNCYSSNINAISKVLLKYNINDSD